MSAWLLIVLISKVGRAHINRKSDELILKLVRGIERGDIWRTLGISEGRQADT